MMRNALRAIATALVLCAIPLSGDAHEHATGIVKERMDLMEAIGKRMKAINARIKDKRRLDAIKDDAQDIAQRASDIVRLFPPGSAHHPSEARATIWQNFADFESKAKALADESARLANVSDRDVAALAAQVRAVAKTCSGCHEVYRVKR